MIRLRVQLPERVGRTAIGLAALAVVVTTAGCAGTAQRASTTPPPPPEPPAPIAAAFTPVVGSVLYAPVPFLGTDGRNHLVYELMLTNYAPATVSVDRVDVLDPATGQNLHSLAGADLAARLRPTSSADFSPELTAGQNGALFLHVVLDGDAPAPSELVHEVTIRTADGTPVVERFDPTPVDVRSLPVLGPPLVGEGYLAADGCCDAVRHTRAILPVNGTPYLAQRYAIDYEQLGTENRIYAGERTDPTSYFVYGDEVLAVADGTVVASLDGQPDQVPGTFPEDIPLDEADGNFVVLDIGDGFFANYAHLQPSSIRVTRGDRVRKGDVLALVGNSGNSVAPHLHFHVMDAASPVAAQGLPYLVDPFTVTGRAASTEAFDTAEAEGTPLATAPGSTPTEHADQMVLDQSIVTFRE